LAGSDSNFEEPDPEPGGGTLHRTIARLLEVTGTLVRLTFMTLPQGEVHANKHSSIALGANTNPGHLESGLNAVYDHRRLRIIEGVEVRS
jgi:hypothetical protein